MKGYNCSDINMYIFIYTQTQTHTHTWCIAFKSIVMNVTFHSFNAREKEKERRRRNNNNVLLLTSNNLFYLDSFSLIFGVKYYK